MNPLKEDFFIEDFFNLNDNITDLDNYLETAKNDFQLNCFEGLTENQIFFSQ